jgi:hypothetical protein
MSFALAEQIVMMTAARFIGRPGSILFAGYSAASGRHLQFNVDGRTYARAR